MPASRKTVTIVFTDVVGSTSLGEELDPELLPRVMRKYFDGMRSVLERHGGTVEKYIGDAIMAVFGVPELHEDDALRAVRAAADMRAELDDLNRELEERWGVRIEVRTGVNTGEVLADQRAADLPLTADAVNVAARLEQHAETAEILLGDSTYRLVRDAVTATPVEPLAVKGKARPLEAWRLLDVIPEARGVARRLDSPIVGRVEELAALEGAFDTAVRERACRLVTVIGEPGLGKSRLIAELVASLRERALVLQGRCLPYGEGITFWPIAEVVRQAAAVAEDDPPETAAQKIAALLPDDEEGRSVASYIGALLGIGETAGSAQETFWAVRRMLETLAANRPVVAVLDDIHWGEPTFLDLLEYVTSFSSGAPLILLCAARPDLLDTRPQWPVGVPDRVTVRLHPLTDEDSERLIENLLGAAPLDDEARARIRLAAEGNPLFVEEILRMLVDDGVLRRDDGRWVASGDLSQMDIPPTIGALLAARLERLTEEERIVVQRAAVVGKVFWWRAVADLAPEDLRASVGAHLQALVRKELVRPDRSTFVGEDAFRFGHILIRDAAYATTTKAVRADAHEGFARWLERRAGDRAAEYEEIVGYHLEQAARYASELGDAERSRDLAGRAGRVLGAAGQRAFRRTDIPATINLLSRATELLDPIDPERVALLTELTEALGEGAQVERARAVIKEATRAARALGDERLLAHANVTSYWGRQAQGVGPGEARAAAEEAVRVFERHGDERGLARAWRLVAMTHWDEVHAAPAEEALERSLQHARATASPREEAEGYYLLSALLVQGPRPVDEASRSAEQVLTEQWTNRGIVASMCHSLGHLRAWEGRFDDARAFGRRYRDILRENGQVTAHADAAEMLADIEVSAGNPQGAVEALRQSEAELKAARAEELSYLDYPLAEALYRAGDYDEAERYAMAAEETDHPLFRPLGSSVLAKLRARRGDPDADRLARQAAEPFDGTDFLNFLGRLAEDRAEVLRLLGRHDEAAAALEDSIRAYEGKGATVLAARARAARDALR